MLHGGMISSSPLTLPSSSPHPGSLHPCLLYIYNVDQIKLQQWHNLNQTA